MFESRIAQPNSGHFIINVIRHKTLIIVIHHKPTNFPYIYRRRIAACLSSQHALDDRRESST